GTHKRLPVAARCRYIPRKNVFERNLFVVPLLSSFLILMQLSSVQGSADKCVLTGRVRQNSRFVPGIGRSRPANRACSCRNVSPDLYVALQQIVHALVIHNEHHQVCALSTNLRTPANSRYRKWRRCAPASAARAASCYARSMLATYHERSFHQLWNYSYALCAVQHCIGNALVRRS